MTGERWGYERHTNRFTVPRQANKLAVLLDALDGGALSSSERVSLTWLAGFEAATVENIAVVITRARQAR